MYVYCKDRSVDAFELVKALGATRLRKFDGIDFWDKSRRHVLQKDDVILCWGSSIPEIDDVRVLNNLEKPMTGFDEWTKLSNAGLPIVYISREKPGTKRPVLEPRVWRAIKELDKSYTVTRDTFVNEYRIHSFAGRSIRAGVKVPREGFTVCLESEWRPESNMLHPWVKSHVGGWRVNYDGFKSTPDLRTLAHNAVKACGLTFAAVDIGMLSSGSYRILEVDRAPRLDPGTVQSYVRAIQRWVKEDKNDTGGVRAGVSVPVTEYAVDVEPEYDDD